MSGTDNTVTEQEKQINSIPMSTIIITVFIATELRRHIYRMK